MVKRFTQSLSLGLKNGLEKNRADFPKKFREISPFLCAPCGVLCIRDRVGQQVIKSVIEPILEAKFREKQRKSRGKVKRQRKLP